jgi:SET domain
VRPAEPLVDPPAVTVGISRIAGRGLFLAAPVAAGTVLGRLDVDLINHSCDPNLGWTGCGDLVALRDIGAEAELTTDYATSIDDPDFVMACHCETYRCRQLIEGTDFRIPQLQQRYAGYWAPRLRDRIDSAPR